MSGPPLKSVIVIGGGLAGLAAAEALAIRAVGEGASRGSAAKATDGKAGCVVTLVEPSGRLGGVLETVRRDGWLVERSADSFLASRPEAIDLVERLGLSGTLVGVAPAVRRALVCSRGRLLPVPAGFRLLAPGRIDSIIATRLLSPWGRLRVLAERFVPRPDVPGGGNPDGDESLEHFAVRRLGREAFERLVQPLVSGIWTADPSRLSMAAACPEFVEMERTHGSLSAGERARLRAAGDGHQAAGARYGQFATLADGMERLPAALGVSLERAGVRRVDAAAARVARRGDDGWEVFLEPTTGSMPGGPQALHADAVVLAVSSRVAARLLGGVDRPLADELAAIEYAGSAIVSLGFPRDAVAHPLDAAGVVVPRGEGRRILAISFSSAKFPGRAPAGSVLLRAFVGGALDPATALLDDERLRPLVLAEVAAVLGIRGTPSLVQIDRWDRAMPQYHVGHLERLRRIARRLEEIPGLALAGNAYEGVGIPQVIASGQAAAARVMARPGRQC